MHWTERPSQGRENRGHAHIEGERWAPKEDSNRHPLGRHSHASDPRFNGENDRKKMQSAAVEEDVMAATNRVWMMQANALLGQTHSETRCIQNVASQTP